MQIRATESGSFGTCGCGRSVSGDCDGSHSYTPDQWAKILEARALDQFLTEDDKNRGSEADEV
jgi:hypothetical protein